MALMPPVGCARLTSPLPAQVSLNRRRMIVSANLSSPPQGDIATVDYVKATASFFEQDSRPIMLFDGVCNLCNGGVKFVRDNDQRRKIRFEALQSEAGKKLLQRSGRAPDDISSVVLVEKDRSYIKSEAVLKIMEYIDLPFPQLAFFLQFIPLCNKDERGVKFWTRPESMGRMAAYFINACHVRAVILINENRFISFFEGYSWESDNSGRSRTSLMMNNQELQVL